MKTRLTSRPGSGEERRNAANAQGATQLKGAAAMPDTRASSLAQLQHQQLASNSSQAAQLKARAEMMAGLGADATMQRVEDEELLQGKFATAQRVEDDELVQGKLEPVQRMEEEELLQGKFATTQRVEDEELLQGKFEPVQRMEDEELVQGKFATTQRVEDEELLQGKFEPVQRMEEEELLQGKFATVQRVEDEELLQGKFEPVQRMEDEELLQGKFAAPSAQLEEKPNNTGMPNQLKSGIESLSGMSMDHVKVHYNSNKPAQLNAHAYAQGSDIHMAPGQEQHLPHEAWHVVQQAQGRVRPTLQMKEGVAVNDDAGLEGEADLMGARAMAVDSTIAQREVAEVQAKTHDTTGLLPGSPFLLQRKIHALPNDSSVIQYRVDPDFTAYLGAGLPTKPIMQAFYDQRVLPEMTRLSNKYIEEDAKEAMRIANTYFTMFMLNSRDDGEIMGKLNALVVAVNAAENVVDADIIARRAGRAVGHEGDPNYVPDAAAEKRDERERRVGAIHTVGTTKPMPLRGILSITEGETILANLQLALTGALGAGYALGNVGVRGSAITGIRSRNNQPFADGLGQHDDVDVASDLDFFFTCAPLEARIRATQQHLPVDRRINAGGTMNAQYLARWLNLPQIQNGYANAAGLLAALAAFETTTESLIGRKSDVTFVGGATAAGLAGDASTLIF